MENPMLGCYSSISAMSVLTALYPSHKIGTYNGALIVDPQTVFGKNTPFSWVSISEEEHPDFFLGEMGYVSIDKILAHSHFSRRNFPLFENEIAQTYHFTANTEVKKVMNSLLS